MPYGGLSLEGGILDKVNFYLQMFFNTHTMGDVLSENFLHITRHLRLLSHASVINSYAECGCSLSSTTYIHVLSKHNKRIMRWSDLLFHTAFLAV